jgi:hypothetical protein
MISLRRNLQEIGSGGEFNCVSGPKIGNPSSKSGPFAAFGQQSCDFHFASGRPFPAKDIYYKGNSWCVDFRYLGAVFPVLVGDLYHSMPAGNALR